MNTWWVEIIGGLGIGIGIIVLIAITAPWWIPLVGVVMNAYGEWLDRRLEKRGK